MTSTRPGRREKIRAATFREIRDTARALLVEQGREGVTINAVARRMGISGPALYRYYDSHYALIAALTADVFRDLTAILESARDEASGVAGRLVAMCRAMRSWALSHRAEFALMFASPASTLIQIPGSEIEEAGSAFGRVFLNEISAIWREKGFPAPDLAGMPPGLAAQLDAYSAQIEHSLPPEAVHVFLTCWIRLYGLVCMEVLHQLDFALSDAEPFFEECIQDLCRALDLDYAAEQGRPA